MVIYARKEGTYIWSDNNGTHKAGKVPQYEPLFTHGEKPDGWYSIERPKNLSLAPDSSYPSYWVKVGDTVKEVPGEVPGPAPSPTEEEPLTVTDEGLAVAIITILKWFKQ